MWVYFRLNFHISLFLLSFLVMILFQWIATELTRLQNLIDRANEKGWRREYPFLFI